MAAELQPLCPCLSNRRRKEGKRKWSLPFCLKAACDIFNDSMLDRTWVIWTHLKARELKNALFGKDLHQMKMETSLTVREQLVCCVTDGI